MEELIKKDEQLKELYKVVSSVIKSTSDFLCHPGLKQRGDLKLLAGE
jgi:hypothetical protein